MTALIAELTEVLVELRSEKAVVIQRLECADDSKRETANLLGEAVKSCSVWKRLRQKEQEGCQEQYLPKKKKNRDWER